MLSPIDCLNLHYFSISSITVLPSSDTDSNVACVNFTFDEFGFDDILGNVGISCIAPDIDLIFDMRFISTDSNSTGTEIDFKDIFSSIFAIPFLFTSHLDSITSPLPLTNSELAGSELLRSHEPIATFPYYSLPDQISQSFTDHIIQICSFVEILNFSIGILIREPEIRIPPHIPIWIDTILDVSLFMSFGSSLSAIGDLTRIPLKQRQVSESSAISFPRYSLPRSFEESLDFLLSFSFSNSFVSSTISLSFFFSPFSPEPDSDDLLPIFTFTDFGFGQTLNAIASRCVTLDLVPAFDLLTITTGSGAPVIPSPVASHPRSISSASSSANAHSIPPAEAPPPYDLPPQYLQHFNDFLTSISWVLPVIDPSVGFSRSGSLNRIVPHLVSFVESIVESGIGSASFASMAALGGLTVGKQQSSRGLEPRAIDYPPYSLPRGVAEVIEAALATDLNSAFISSFIHLRTFFADESE
jgi:hypothetical protein